MCKLDSDLQGFPPGMTYVPMQKIDKRYSDDMAIIRGTLFPNLDLPFKNYENKSALPNTLLCEVMKKDFVCFELGLYLDTHPNDNEIKLYYNQCAQKSKDARKNYEASGGQLLKSGCYSHGGNWVDDPWPWEYDCI